MARPLTNAERQLISAMITSAKATDPDRFEGQHDWYQWRQELHKTLDRVTAGRACDCGRCPSVQLLFDGQQVASSASRVILEAFVSDGMVMLFIDEDRPSCLEIAPYLDNKIELPSEGSLIF